MEMPKDIQDHIVSYFLKGDKEISDPVLLEWLNANESNRILFERYKKIWNESEYYMKSDAFDTEKAWIKINKVHTKNDLYRRRIKNVCYVMSGIAASVLILFVLSFWRTRGDGSSLLVSMNAEYGGRSEIILPDGSIVKLNSGSNITYSYNPRDKIREVSFQGEGFFDISKSKEPFIIKLENDLEVKVLGTSFNLCAYTDEKLVQASLVEGTIELNHASRTLRMNAGEMAVFDKETNQLKLSEGVLTHTYGWLENKLYMDNMSLGEVCKYLERSYNVEITIREELKNTIHYNGVLKEESIVDVLEALNRLSNIKYHIKGKSICITTN